MERLEQQILSVLKSQRGPVSLAELMRRLELRSAQRRVLRRALGQLITEGKIRALSNKHYSMPPVRRGLGVVEGHLSITLQGYGFVRPSAMPGDARDLPPDIFIRAADLASAIEGDLVAVTLTSPARGDRNATGTIQAVLERAHASITGWFQRSSTRRGLVTPRNPRIGRGVEVRTRPEAGWPEDFHWVVVRVTEFTPAPQPLVGEITEVLGDDDAKGIDVLLLVRDRGIVAEFPHEVEEEAGRLRTDWTRELDHRSDFRPLGVVTIDPETAKDFDDALSIEVRGHGREDNSWVLRVHIADVSHYVHPGGAIDAEAYRRGTSIYPVDRVVPMLPERLSNDLCSLRPGEDRPTLTVEAEIDAQGEIRSTRFQRSVIHSRHRLSYREVQALFDRSDPVLAGRLADVADSLQHLRDLARVLRRNRLRRGALDLDIPEAEVHFDSQGRPNDIRFAPRLESHQLVEECMLLANEAVARHLTQHGWPMIYRIHEPAQQHQLKHLEPMLRALGIKISLKSGMTPQAIQRALTQAETRTAGHIFRRLILRALARARYSPTNPGHFGLASDCYCHFTSPIRRYPDLVVHRLLVRSITGAAAPEGDARSGLLDELDETAEQSSDRERLAQEIEWDTTKLKSLEFMQQHLGEEFEGYVCGVQPFGLFVELETYPVEGLIPVGNLPYDRYQVDDLGVRLVGKRRGRQYQLADRVRVRVLNIDLTALEMDLKLIE